MNSRRRLRLHQALAGLGLRDREALHVVGAELGEQFHRLEVLDPLGDALHPEVVRQLDDRLQDRDVGRMRAGALDEGAVDLQRIGRQVAQVAEGRVAGAEVVERDLRAQRLRPVDEAPRVLQVVQRHALGDFQAQQRRRQRVRRQHRERVLDEALVVQRAAAQVDADEVGGREARPVLLDPDQRLLEDPAVDGRHAPVVVGRADDLARRNHVVVAVAHPQQDLEVQRVERPVQRHDRLHLEEQAVVLQPLPDPLDQPQLLDPLAEQFAALLVRDDVALLGRSWPRGRRGPRWRRRRGS